MEPEYLTVAKLGGLISIPNNMLLAKEMLDQLVDHRIIFCAISPLRKNTQRIVIIPRMLLNIEFCEVEYKMKKGDTIFLEINNE
jgi:hypothetical protein